VCEAAIYAQAEATKIMAATHMSKNQLMQEQNLLMLMTLLDTEGTIPEAREFLQLRKAEELKKLRKRLTEKEGKEQR
jgi:hypothetical protein